MSATTQVLDAPGGAVRLVRDAWGVPDLTAGCAGDAWWAQGYVAATDRLWQLEYDRRRATGRWSQVAGATGVAIDAQGLRLDLVRAARADVDAMDAETLAAFTAYADGVNAGAAAGPLPTEFAVAGIDFEPWQPWHSIAAFKVRHVLMGEWQRKISQLTVLVRCGAEAFDALEPTVAAGMSLTCPSGGVASGPGEPVEIDRSTLAELRDRLSFLDVADDQRAAVGQPPDHVPSDHDGGSNVWAVAGSRTMSGKPLLINDSHRSVDVPNAYWQVRLRCDDFDVAGATFPGVPGFPHFGHNGAVGWAITHGTGDAQDLVLEEIRGTGDGLECRTASGWVAVECRTETIQVAGAEPVAVECLRTPTGPIVHADPAVTATGRDAGAAADRPRYALSLRWTATDRPCRQFGVPLRMVHASTVAELLDSQRGWVDPINNLVCADVHGQIGYLLRGELPVRDRRALRIPLPAWEFDWVGTVPFVDLPREVDPPDGVIANGNNTVVDPAGGPLVGYGYAETYRAARIRELLTAGTDHSLEDMRRMQSDRVSLGARAWLDQLRRRVGRSVDRAPFAGLAGRAHDVLVGWDGDLAAPGPAPLVYACFRRVLVHRLFPDLPPASDAPVIDTALRRVLGRLGWRSPDGSCPADTLPDELLADALAGGWSYATELGGPDPDRWSWGAAHPLEPQHLLHPELASPAPRQLLGDAETIAAAGYYVGQGRHRGERRDFPVTLTSVYRQLLDFSDLRGSRWVIPGGAVGDPASPHYADQLDLWAADQLIPMHPDPAAEPDGP